MNKQEFLTQLRRGLSGLPEEDIEERLAFYSEMIDDRMEDGITEEDAVCEMGSIDGIVSQIIADIPLGKLVKEKIRPKQRLKTWEIVLLALGSPIWLSLLIAAGAVSFAFYILLWTVILVLWSAFAAFAAGGLTLIAAGVHFMITGNGLTGIAMTGAGLACVGVSVFLFFGAKAATKAVLKLVKKPVIRIKDRFIKKEEE